MFVCFLWLHFCVFVFVFCLQWTPSLTFTPSTSWSWRPRSNRRLSSAWLTASSPSWTWTPLPPKSSRPAGTIAPKSRPSICPCFDVGFFFSSKCRFLMTADMQSCGNQLCPGGEQPFSGTTGFDLLVDLTDHTGTLQACSLRGAAAERTLGCSVGNSSEADGGGQLRTAVIHWLLLNMLLPASRRTSSSVWPMISAPLSSGSFFWKDAKYTWRYSSLQKACFFLSLWCFF